MRAWLAALTLIVAGLVAVLIGFGTLDPCAVAVQLAADRGRLDRAGLVQAGAALPVMERRRCLAALPGLVLDAR